MLVYSCVSFETASYQGVPLPDSAQAVGWVMVALCLLPIVIYALYAFVITSGTMKEVRQFYIDVLNRKLPLLGLYKVLNVLQNL